VKIVTQRHMHLIKNTQEFFQVYKKKNNRKILCWCYD